ncbi:cytochrome c biogenesis protein CcdA [Acanthopleuribacter pedis]|uniref:Thioredoxin family protein n=1 Tax=Acanthopleuribacter pedis TaxID=442870 RepID=A0A8J7Q2R5_9BACT|nr:thioredoxin family protein [Acanthopleuribacter pedis]MBO1318195.1 thioredoxin family protein [Acanthopleuribacter pedis]
MKHLVLLVLLAAMPLFGGTHVAAKIVADHTVVAKGEPFSLAIHLKMRDHWHTYWESPGFAGLPTEWILEPVEGLQVEDLQFPVPKRFVDDAGYVTYGYDDEALLIAQARYTGSETEISIKGLVKWLECKESCIPGEAKAELNLGVGQAKPTETKLFEQFRARLPRPAPKDFQYAVSWQFAEEKWNARVTFGEAESASIKTKPEAITFFPTFTEEAQHDGIKARHEGGRLVVDLEFGAFAAEPEAPTLGGVFDFGADHPPLRLQLYPEPSAELGVAPASSAKVGPPAETPALDYSFWTILLFAFLGGAILNLMPCVLPVLSLKVFAVVKEAGENHWHRIKLGWVYTAGIMVCFLVFSLFFIVAKSAGNEIGVGFQFQNPVFVIGMTALIFVLGLSFLGVYEISAPDANALYGLSNRQGAGGAFFQGALMTLLSTPCTAPLLGTAYAWALTQNALVILLVFQVIAFGLAFPYLLLCYIPGLVKLLPKPGPWMHHFKVVLGFLMMATVVWLFSVLVDLTGRDGVIGTMTMLVGLSFSAWVFGQSWFTESRRGGLLVAVLSAAASIFVGMFMLFDISNPKAARERFIEDLRLDLQGQLQASQTNTGELGDQYFKTIERRFSTPDTIAWIPYSEKGLAHLRQTNSIVFVDFTAAWCLTCKANEKLVIDRSAVRQVLADEGIYSVKVDYTNKDDHITQMLQQFNRAGVPLYVVYPGQGDPIVLPETLTQKMLLDAFSDARVQLTQQTNNAF